MTGSPGVSASMDVASTGIAGAGCPRRASRAGVLRAPNAPAVFGGPAGTFPRRQRGKTASRSTFGSHQGFTRNTTTGHKRHLFVGAAAGLTRPGFVDDKDVEYSGAKATLDGETVWRLQLCIKEAAAPVVLKVVFDREEGYEPPQGLIRVVEDEVEVALEGAVNRWQLGEDPDKKSANPMDGGGLWIWAFFSETPFPFLLFSIELRQLGTVYAKVPHARGPKRGTVLSQGCITTRTLVDVAADAIGLSRAQIAQAQAAGTVRLAPLDRY